MSVQPAGVQAGNVPAAEADLPPIRRQVAGDQVEQRGLTGTVRPDQGGDGAALDREGATVHSSHPAEDLGGVLDLKQRAHAAPPPTVTSASGRAGGTAAAFTVPRRRRRRIRSWIVGRMPRGSSSMITRNTAA